MVPDVRFQPNVFLESNLWPSYYCTGHDLYHFRYQNYKISVLSHHKTPASVQYYISFFIVSDLEKVHLQQQSEHV